MSVLPLRSVATQWQNFRWPVHGTACGRTWQRLAMSKIPGQCGLSSGIYQIMNAVHQAGSFICVLFQYECSGEPNQGWIWHEQRCWFIRLIGVRVWKGTKIIHGLWDKLMEEKSPEHRGPCQAQEVCEPKRVRGCEEGVRGKSQRCPSSIACAYGHCFRQGGPLVWSRKAVLIHLYAKVHNLFWNNKPLKSGVLLWKVP